MVEKMKRAKTLIGNAAYISKDVSSAQIQKSTRISKKELTIEALKTPSEERTFEQIKLLK